MGVDWEILKHEFIQADQSTQLDSLALNLKRIQMLVSGGKDKSVVDHLVRESQFFIEWSVSTLDLDTNLDCAVELADLQRLLSRWKLSDWWGEDLKRKDVAGLAEAWRYRVANRAHPQISTTSTTESTPSGL